MGVQGLWKLIAPCGKMVPLEGMSNKILAIDVSIWLHQALTGVHDMEGAAAALLLLFHRLCKLLFYKIKPVFVFDGGVPAIKRQTMATRRMRKSKARSEATRIRAKLLKNMLKHEALRRVLADDNILAPKLSSLTLPGPCDEEELYKLPAHSSSQTCDSNSESGSDHDNVDTDTLDLDSVDVTSDEFRSLPPELRHDILSDLKDTRKQSSWRTLDQMPDNSQEFSNFQMNRLLKRRAIQVSLEECGKEMGEKDVSMQDLRSMLGGIAGSDDCRLVTGRIAQDDSARFVLVQHEPAKPATATIAPQSEDNSELALQQAIIESLTDLPPAHTMDTIQQDIVDVLPEPKLIVEDIPMTCDFVLEKTTMEQDDPENIDSPQEIIAENPKTKEEENSKQHDDAKNIDSPQEIIAETPKTKEEENSKQQDDAEKFDPPPDIRVENPKAEGNSKPQNEIELTETLETQEQQERVTIPLANPMMETSECLPVENQHQSKTEYETHIVELVELETPQTGDFEASSDTDADDFVPVRELQDEHDPGDNSRRVAAAEHLGDTLARERSVLLEDQARQQRLQQNVSDQIYADAQELLRLFGVPYVIAPMEAEAQCATLETLGLTNGTITDDSDIWLFGGHIVYKDFFNQKKRVQQFKSEDIERILKLNRDELVRLAMLVGSDYTTGLTGVGPVTALEILATFPSGSGSDVLSGLRNFREWLASGFIKGPTRIALKNKLSNTQLITGFPSSVVAEAYFKPTVDESKEPFSWSKPDLAMLEKYTRIKFGWSSDRCKQQLTPVMKKLLEKNEQPSILRYFETVAACSVGGTLSKRVEGAVKRLGRSPDFNEISTPQPTINPTLDSITERLHQKTVIPQREKDRLQREQLKKRASQVLRKGNKKKKISLPVGRINLSESSSDTD